MAECHHAWDEQRRQQVQRNGSAEKRALTWGLGVLQGQEGINKYKLSPKKKNKVPVLGLGVSNTYVITSMQEAFT